MSKEKPTTAVAEYTQQVPDFLRDRQGAGRGMEAVTADDIVIPRVELIQALSPARDKTNPAYIPGAEEGMLFNNVTRQLYGASVMVVPVVYRKQWLVWKDRKQGGGANGFRGAFDSELAAQQHVATLGEDGLDVTPTAQHFCLVIAASGAVEEAVISMSKTKLKVSKRWNSLMRLAGGDCFERMYSLSAVTETNARNEKFYNFSVEMLGYVSREIFAKAEALYESVGRGQVVVSNDFDVAATEEAGSEEF